MTLSGVVSRYPSSLHYAPTTEVPIMNCLKELFVPPTVTWKNLPYCIICYIFLKRKKERELKTNVDVNLY